MANNLRPSNAPQTTAELVAALQHPRCYPHEVRSIRVLETHISYVLLTGGYAYKIKKPVNLGFLDFSTLAARRVYCREEIRLNARTAPELYLEVVPITLTATHPLIGGGGAPVEYAVRMREFGADALLDSVLARGALASAHVEALASTIAAFHARVSVAGAETRHGDPDGTLALVREAFDFADSPVLSASIRARLRALAAWSAKAGARLRGTMAERKAQGYVRECHGDLHLANIVLLEGRPVPFDCIEFSPRLRWCDLMSEAAFTFMDFHAHGRPDYAYQFLNTYLEATGDYEGCALLPYYGVYRAIVRAKVALLRARQADADAAAAARAAAAIERFVAVAETLAQPAALSLTITFGLSGSGKTHVANLAAPSLGAVRIRSDVERKRLHGLTADARTESAVGGGLYSSEASRRTYERLTALAKDLLATGLSVLVDATFLRRADRDAFRALAQAQSARFMILACAAPSEVLRERVTARAQTRQDASEADLVVLEHQLQTHEPLACDEESDTVRIYTDAPIAEVAARCASLGPHASGQDVPAF